MRKNSLISGATAAMAIVFCVSTHTVCARPAVGDGIMTSASYVRQESERTVRTQEQKEIIGRFRDQWGVYTLYRVNGKYYMHNEFSDGSSSTDQLEVKIRNNRTTYNVVGDSYEYYEVRNGKLYIYDEDGNLGLVYEPA